MLGPGADLSIIQGESNHIGEWSELSSSLEFTIRYFLLKVEVTELRKNCVHSWLRVLRILGNPSLLIGVLSIRVVNYFANQ